MLKFKMSTILNPSLSGILVSMLKKEKKKVQEAYAQLANFSNGDTSHSSSTSTLGEKRLKAETSEDFPLAQHLMNRQRVWFCRDLKMMINLDADYYCDHGFGDAARANNSSTVPLLLSAPPQALDQPPFSLDIFG
ncbi:hypothetical protein SRHO_G00138310 [Serrasalmus rhombeus]